MKNENKKERLWKVQFKFTGNFICVEAVKGGCYVAIEGRPSVKVRFPGFFESLRGVTLQAKVHREALKVQAWCVLQNEKEKIKINE